MAKSKINPNRFIYNQCDDGRKFLPLVKPPVADVRHNGGSHVVVTVREGEYAGETMCIPEHELGVGLACKIWKWFVRMGIIALMITVMIYVLGAIGA